jgi:hypothetical protein
MITAMQNRMDELKRVLKKLMAETNDPADLSKDMLEFMKLSMQSN